MIVQERMAVYINSLDTGNGPFLDTLQRQALQDEVPIIRQDMQSFLKVLLAVHQPKKILEVGTAVGFSAHLMADHTSEECQITTIEKYEKRIPAAKENFKKAGRENRITLLEGDALEIMKGLNESYDMIFMDAAKGQYIHFLPDALRLLRTAACLSQTMCCRTGTSLSRITRWSAETARSTSGCGNICMCLSIQMAC